MSGLVEPRRRPPRRTLAEHLDERVGVVDQPAVQLVEGEVDHAVVQVVAHHLREQAAEQRARSAPRGSAARRRRSPGRRCARRGPCPGRWPRRRPTSSTTRRALAGSESQSPTRAEIVAASTRSRMMSSWRKFSPTNSSSPLPSSSLRLGISAVCGIGQPQRVLEERGHREPVGDGTDHRGLGAGVDEAPDAPSRPSVATYTTAAKHQQRHRDGAHPSQPATARLVGARVGRDQRDRRGGHGGGRVRCQPWPDPPLRRHTGAPCVHPKGDGRLRACLARSSPSARSTCSTSGTCACSSVPRRSATGSWSGCLADALNVRKKGRVPVFSERERIDDRLRAAGRRRGLRRGEPGAQARLRPRARAPTCW